MTIAPRSTARCYSRFAADSWGIRETSAPHSVPGSYANRDAARDCRSGRPSVRRCFTLERVLALGFDLADRAQNICQLDIGDRRPADQSVEQRRRNSHRLAMLAVYTIWPSSLRRALVWPRSRAQHGLNLGKGAGHGIIPAQAIIRSSDAQISPSSVTQNVGTPVDQTGPT